MKVAVVPLATVHAVASVDVGCSNRYALIWFLELVEWTDTLNRLGRSTTMSKKSAGFSWVSKVNDRSNPLSVCGRLLGKSS